MQTRQEVMNQYTMMKYTLLEDQNNKLTFRKNFSWGWFIFWLLFSGIGGFIYIIYHYTKPKVFVDYKK